MYRIVLSPLQERCPGVFKWCLDYPKHEQQETLDALLTGLTFQGWVLAEDEKSDIKPYIRAGLRKTYVDLTVNRADVLNKVLNETDVAKHPLLTCGFRQTIEQDTDAGAFGISVNGVDTDLVLFRIEGSLRVLEGNEGWLFLDNDTNQSVDQFRGMLLLNKHQQEAWQRYFIGLQTLAQKHRLSAAVLAAPAKEHVLAAYYPYKKGQVTPVGQVEKIAGELAFPFSHPVGVLQASTERPFRYDDTHWTSHGAREAWLDTVGKLGEPVADIARCFEADKYKTVQQGGDLGNKCFPPRRHEEQRLVGVTYRNWVVYDNHLPNMGRIMRIENPEALIKKHCLIFGSSSAYTMMDFIARTYHSVLFVHSAGHLDAEVVAQEKPDVLVGQTNARFVVRPPETNYSLEAEVLGKWQVLNEDEQDEISSKVAEWVKKGLPSTVLGYHHWIWS